MRLVAEFTTEPFRSGSEPPAHAAAALHAAEEAGLACDVGPFGTSVSGDADAVLAALGEVVRAAITHDATRVTLQVAVAHSSTADPAASTDEDRP